MIKLPEKYIIAVDGHSSCGKSTLAKDIAKLLKMIYIDTGAMYRSVTLYALQNKIIKENKIEEATLKKQINNLNIYFQKDNAGKVITFLNNEAVENEIRSPEVSQWVSPISKLKFVRDHLVAQQREMAKNGCVILDGRDIGTVVFPDANLKIFLTASADVRAKRRFLEMKNKYTDITIKDIKENLIERDRIDSSRKESPLRQAEDARVLDNSELNRDEQLKIVLDWIKNGL